MSLVRREFVGLAMQEGSNVRELCRRFGISPTTGYKWIHRAEDRSESFEDRSRRPRSSPNQTESRIEEVVVQLRDLHPQWNARKIRRLLKRQLSGQAVPAASTVGRILKRRGRISEWASANAHKFIRFEHEEPNELSQLDFKGHFAIGQGRCFPLTMLDDHSRFAQILQACANEQTLTVQPHLIAAFRKYGVPWAINMDNGNPWGNPTGNPYTKLTVWMIRIGIRISHSRPLHPQTNGKDERFHRTLKAEVLGTTSFSTLAQAQWAFDQWREIYNHERPHEALALEVPASRYRPSPRSYSESLLPIEYGPGDLVHTVRQNGMVMFWKRYFFVGQAFGGQPVAARPTQQDGLWDLFYCHKRITTINQRTPEPR